MVRHEFVENQMQQTTFSAAEASEVVRIEELLRRAHQIHRAHGGLFGYDLEDWLEAEREMTTRNDRSLWDFEQATESESKAAGEGEAFVSCAAQPH